MIWFHRVLIGTAIAFFTMLAVWEVRIYRLEGDVTALALGLGSAAVALLLGYYLVNLKRFLGR